jgi:hypothetical protein
MPSNGLFVRLHLDESIYPDLAETLRQHGVDCTCAVEEQMLTKTDGEQLELVAAQGRCIVSFNVRMLRNGRARVANMRESW